MKKYDTYKPSGIEWIGEIPSNWAVKKFKYCFNLINEKSDETTPKVGLENIESWTGKFIDTFTEYEGDGEEFCANDILFGKLRPYLAKVYLADFKGKAVGDIFIFRGTREINPRYGAQLILSKNFIEVTNSATYGSKMPRVSWDFIGNLLLPLPDEKEQQAIANYLDQKTTEIDQLIADKKKLLELYEQEKTTIINQAVTKGINSNAPMKDSGIEWLGEIPEHWEVKRLKTIARVQTGRTPKIQNSQIDFFENGEINWFTPSDFDGNSELTDSKRKLIKEAIETGEAELFPENSIYLVSIGATLGKVSFFKEKASANQQINIIVFNQTFNPIFAYYFLIGNKEMVTIEADYTTLPILNQSKTKSLNFSVPPFKEQQSIVNYIENECTRIAEIKSKTEKLIELLTEYRTALISEVVTGKIKVID